MPSTRKLKAREKRPRQSAVIFDLKNRDERIGTYTSNELESNSEDRNDRNIEVDLGSDRPSQ